MSDYNLCHGPKCHTKHTVDRVRGVKGSKVLRTRKVKMFGQRNIWSFFCSMTCYNDFAKEYMAELLAIAPRSEALETPIDVVVENKEDYYGNPYKVKMIKEVVENA